MPKSIQYGGEEKLAQLGQIMEKFFEHEMRVKMLHFQTQKYGIHKILDVYLCGFRANFDRFMEAAQGALNQRVNTQEININVRMWRDDVPKIINSLEKFINTVLKAQMEQFTDNPGLLAIRDEMVADADKLKYLLTFD